MPTRYDMAIQRLEARLIGGLAAACIAALGIAGHAERAAGFHHWAEATVPTWFSAVLLFTAAVLAVWLSGVDRRGSRAALVAFAAFLAAVGVTELFNLHGRLEDWTGIDWKLLYAPLGLAGGGALVVVLCGIRPLLPRLMLVAGAGAWAAAQAVEARQYSGGAGKNVALVLPEELIEMAGSTLFGIALLLTLQAALCGRARRAAA